MQTNSFSPPWSPAFSLASMVVFVGVGFLLVGPLVGMQVVGVDPQGLGQALIRADPAYKFAALVVQGCATGIGLIVFPLLYTKWFNPPIQLPFSLGTGRDILGVLYAAALVVLLVPLNSFVVEWNAAWSLPDFMSGVAQWAQAREHEARQITRFLTTFDSITDFLITWGVVALLPGVGEELFFRGMIQPEIHRGTGNIHVAILGSAALFSAIHMQFFSCIPRFFLGVLFGYLYHWSKNLSIPMWAHVTNNGFAITMIYMHQRGLVETDVESTEAMPILMTIICALGAIMVLGRFKRLYLGGGQVIGESSSNIE